MTYNALYGWLDNSAWNKSEARQEFDNIYDILNAIAAASAASQAAEILAARQGHSTLLLAMLARGYDPTKYGASGAGGTTTTGSVSSGTKTLTVASASTWEVGHGIKVAGAGAAGVDLVTSVTAISGTTFTLADNASTTVSAATTSHDDTDALEATIDAIVAAGGGVMVLPPDKRYLTTTALDYPAKVNILGAGQGLSSIEGTAASCLQADASSPPGGQWIRGVKLVGGDYAFNCNNQSITRLIFEDCYLDGGTGGYGFYATGQLIEIRFEDCVLTQKVAVQPASGKVANVIAFNNCRFNATGSKPADGYDFLLGGGAGNVNTVNLKNCTFEVGGISIGPGTGNMFNIKLDTVGFFDPAVVGDTAINIASGSSLINLSNIMAENYHIESLGTSILADSIYAYSVDFNNSAGVFAWGVTTSIDDAHQNCLNDSSAMMFEGTVYGRAFNKQTASIRVPASNAADTFQIAIVTPSRKARITGVWVVFESSVTGQNTNFSTLKFYAGSGGNLLGQTAFTLGTDATANTVFTQAITPVTQNENTIVDVRKAVDGGGLALPAFTVTVEYYDQGTA